MTYNSILVEHEGPISWIVLNRPHRLNAMNDELLTELSAALAELKTSGGPVIGLLQHSYERGVFSHEPGDLLVGFTDGVTEAPNPDGEEFGDHRLTELLIRHRDKPLEGIANEIRASLSVWSGNAERYDDTTLILAKRLG